MFIQLTWFSALFLFAFIAGAYKMFPPSADFPDLTKHNNVMANHLTPQVRTEYIPVYANLCVARADHARKL